MSYLHLNNRSEHKKGESTILSICVVHPSSSDPQITAMDTDNHLSSGKNRKPGKHSNKLCNTEEKKIDFVLRAGEEGTSVTSLAFSFDKNARGLVEKSQLCFLIVAESLIGLHCLSDRGLRLAGRKKLTSLANDLTADVKQRTRIQLFKYYTK